VSPEGRVVYLVTRKSKNGGSRGIVAGPEREVSGTSQTACFSGRKCVERLLWDRRAK